MMAFLSLTAVGQSGKEVQVELIDREIYVREASGQLRQLTHDGKPKEHVMVSPSGNRIVYHAPFDPYKSPPERPIFTVLDRKTGNVGQQIPIYWPARVVESVEWISDGIIMVRGEGRFLAVLNLKVGKQTHNLIGSDFTLSPDATMIVFRHDFNPRYGPIAPESRSDSVLLSLIENGPTSGRVESRFDSSNFKVIYPDLLAWGEVEQKRYENLDERHQIKSTFVWSPDSHKAAFVEVHQQRYWLISLRLDRMNGDVAVSHKSFDLGPPVGKILALSWSEKNQVTISGEKTTWLIDVETGTMQPKR
jgi:hypothetical protein